MNYKKVLVIIKDCYVQSNICNQVLIIVWHINSVILVITNKYITIQCIYIYIYIYIYIFILS